MIQRMITELEEVVVAALSVSLNSEIEKMKDRSTIAKEWHSPEN
jgi:hypothetical protein